MLVLFAVVELVLIGAAISIGYLHGWARGWEARQEREKKIRR